MKLSRKAIKEGLQQVPIEAVILGATNPTQLKLTNKEKQFAEELVLNGATKSDAYRKAYKPRGKNATIHKRAHEVSKRGEVIGYAESLKAAMEAQRFATPAGLRALTIHELTKGALDPDMPPAQRVKCLELLGKITEVALFTERREVVKVSDAESVRAALLDSIRSAIKSDATDVDLIEGDDLLAELAQESSPTGSENEDSADPPGVHPPSHGEDDDPPLHSNPHNESSDYAAHNGSSDYASQESLGTQSNVLPVEKDA